MGRVRSNSPRNEDTMAYTYPEVLPPEAVSVVITLNNGARLDAEYHTEQWWADLPGNDAQVPIDNAHVAAWEERE